MTTWYAWLNVLYVSLKPLWGDLCGSVDRGNCSSSMNTNNRKYSIHSVTLSLYPHPNLHVFLSRGHEMENQNVPDIYT